MPESDLRDDAPTVRLQQRDLAASAIPRPRTPEPERAVPAPAPTRGASLAWIVLAVAAVVLAVVAAITAGLLSRQATALSPPVPAASPAALPGLAPVAAAPAGPEPLLGVDDGVTPGFGQVRPTALNHQGGVSSSIRDIAWQSWGGAQATGTGTAVYVAPGRQSAQGSEEQATIIATDLGACGGKPAYSKVQWFFPQHGGSYEEATATDACS